METKDNNYSVVIIGGAGKIGQSFAKACIAKDMNVCVMDLCEQSTWEKLEIKSDLFFNTDINDSKSLSQAIEKTIDYFGKIDSVVNSSYPKTKSYGNAVFDISLSDFNQNINLHLGGYFNVIQKFSKFFLKQGYGNIINIASIQGIALPKFDHYQNTTMVSPIEYTAAKNSIIAITKYMAKYLKKTNIRLNCISPGGIKDNQPQSFIEKYNSVCSSKGILDTDDLTSTLLFLISDNSKLINGQNIVVDDGWSL